MLVIEASPSSLRGTLFAQGVEGEAMGPVPSVIVSAPVASAPIMGSAPDMASIVSLIVPDLASGSPSPSHALLLAPVDVADSPPQSSAVSSARQTTPSLVDGLSESGLGNDVAPAAGDSFLLRRFVIIY